MVGHFFIGFRTLPLDNDGVPTQLADAWWESDCFCIEFGNRRFIFFTTAVREKKR